MEFETIDIAKLETLNLALTNYFAHSLPNGKLYKNTINGLATFMAPYVTSVGASGYVEVTGNVLPNPVITNAYSLIAAGTYTQTGEGNVVATGAINIITWNGTTWSLTKAIPFDLAGYATKSELNKMLNSIAGELSVNTQNALSTINSASGSTNVYYVNQYNATISRNSNGVEVKVSADGNIQVVKVSSGNSVVSEIGTFSVLSGINKVYYNNVSLGIGERIGIRNIDSAKVYFTTASGVGFYAQDGNEIVPNAEIAYNILYTSTDFETLTELTESVSKTENDLNAIKGEVENLPVTEISSMTTNGGAGSTYINNYPVIDNEQLIKKIIIRSSGSGLLSLIQSDANYSNRILLLQINVVNGINTIDVNIVLPANKRLGILSNTGTYFYGGDGTITGLGAWSSDANAFVPSFELGYGYVSEGQVLYSLTDIYKELQTVAPQSEMYKLNQSKQRMFFDDFNTESEWTKTGWAYSLGKYTSSATGVDNRLELPRKYFIDKRAGRALVKFSSDSDFRIHIKYGGGGLGAGEGASMFGINAATGKINIYQVDNALDGNANVTSVGVTNTVLISQDIAGGIIAGRTYLVEVEKDGYTSRVRVTDILSAQKTEAECIGWGCGRQNQYYGFFVNSGGAVEIQSFEVACLMKDIDVMFKGDSITEGVMVLDKALRYAELYRSQYNANTVISARGGSTIDDLIDTFETEIKYILPKSMFVLIGANGGNTYDKIQIVINLCKQYGIDLYWNYCTCQQADDSHVAKNVMISSFNLPGCRLDIATAKDNYPLVDGSHPSPRYDNTKYYDAGLHPNQIGDYSMFQRFAIDTPNKI